MHIYTVGHSTRSFESLVEILRATEVKHLVDIRALPRSRRLPQFNKDNLTRDLPAAGIEYVHESRLGGLRHSARDESSNTAWRNDSFRSFADYMQTDDFRNGLDDLVSIAAALPTAIMCAEAVPWRCHRSVVADALLVRGWTVCHLLNTGRSYLHRLTPFAHVSGMQITYPPAV